MKKYAFGIDIGGTTCKIGFFDTEGRLLSKWEIPTRTEQGGSKILPDLRDALENFLQKEQLDKGRILGIGLGVPGPVLADGTVVKCVNLGWDVFNIEAEFGAMTGLKVRAGNDANVAALGELWKGAGEGNDHMVMVTLGTGVGGGIITNGQILSGPHGAGGEIGHIKMNPQETESCGCGKKGCLEQYASATGIVRMAKSYLASHKEETVLRDIYELSAKDIFDGAKNEDAVSIKLVEELGRLLGTALANIACVADPQVIVLGGGVSKAGRILTDTVKKYYAANAFHACEEVECVLATLGNDAGIYGGVKLLF